MIGSMQSIFWVSGFDDLVRVIDDPAYVLEDEIVEIPQGTHPGRFLLDRYWDDGKIPGCIIDKYMGQNYDDHIPFVVAPGFTILPQCKGSYPSRALHKPGLGLNRWSRLMLVFLGYVGGRPSR